MGFLDKFKKRTTNTLDVKDETPINRDLLDIEFRTASTGGLQVDYYNPANDAKKSYDSTRLIMDKPITLAGKQLWNCRVSWYGIEDGIGRDFIKPRSEQYTGVLAQIDLDLLQHDPTYCKMVMKNLLDQDRVRSYLNEGLKENPERPCGKYIGGVGKTEKGYAKFFSPSVGEASHNSKLMVDRRKQLRTLRQKELSAKIASKQAEIEDLKKKALEDMER